MTRRYSPSASFVHIPGRASEHSIPFSDLRADADTRLLRLWLDNELDDDGTSWRSIDIARGGLSIVRKLKTAEYANISRNEIILKHMQRAAFALYQPDKITDDDGNFTAIPLARNSSLMLGRTPDSPFVALRGSALSQKHLGIYVDDDDTLAIEAYDIDNMPQIEVIATDSETAVRTGLAPRDYVRPRSLPDEGSIVSLPRLEGFAKPIPPQFLSNIAVPIGEPAEQSAKLR